MTLHWPSSRYHLLTLLVHVLHPVWHMFFVVHTARDPSLGWAVLHSISEHPVLWCGCSAKERRQVAYDYAPVGS